jgi:hypothetical protein
MRKNYEGTKMTESRNPLLIALIVLQIATLCLMMLLFFNSPAQQGPHESAFAIDPNRPESNNLAPANALQTELRAMRAEIAALRAAAGAPAPVAPDAAPQISDQELQAREQAVNASGSVIRGAIAAGVWTRADTQALMTQLVNISPEQRLALVEEFYAAINRQELVLKDFPPL